MTDNPDLWEVRILPDDLTLKPWGEASPALVLVQGERRVRVDLSHVKSVVAGLTDAAAALAKVTDEQLAQAETLEGATLPDGTVHE